MQVDVLNNLIYLVKHGSYAYGLNTPESDIDVKGVLIHPTDILLSYSYKFDQSENNKELHDQLASQLNTTSDNIDSVVYGLHKFIKLAADCNPNIIEVLWVDEDDIIFMSEAGKILREAREDFISLKAKHTFSGYAFSQLKRIKTHRKWLLEPPEKPRRSDYGLLDAKLLSGEALGTVKKLGESGHNFSNELMDAIRREKQYASALAHYKQYENWKVTRNPKRAEMEAESGYDRKHATHLIRLLLCCNEILSGKGVKVKRDDRDFLLAIRNGEYDYDSIVKMAEEMEKESERLYKLNPAGLRKTPNHKKLNEMCIRLQKIFG